MKIQPDVILLWWVYRTVLEMVLRKGISIWVLGLFGMCQDGIDEPI
jgi:hypothetical protein